MYEDDEKIYEEQNRRLAQFFVDDHEYLCGILDCFIDASDGKDKEEWIGIKNELDKRINDLYPFVEGNNKKGR